MASCIGLVACDIAGLALVFSYWDVDRLFYLGAALTILGPLIALAVVIRERNTRGGLRLPLCFGRAGLPRGSHLPGREECELSPSPRRATVPPAPIVNAGKPPAPAASNPIHAGEERAPRLQRLTEGGLGANPGPRRQRGNGLYKGRERRDSNPRPPRDSSVRQWSQPVTIGQTRGNMHFEGNLRVGVTLTAGCVPGPTTIEACAGGGAPLGAGSVCRACA